MIPELVRIHMEEKIERWEAEVASQERRAAEAESVAANLRRSNAALWAAISETRAWLDECGDVVTDKDKAA